MLKPQQQPSRREFISLTALLMSVVSLSIDVMLPALGALAFGLVLLAKRESIHVSASTPAAGGGSG